MGIGEDFDSSIQRMKELLQEQTSDHLTELYEDSNNALGDSNVQTQIDETNREIQHLNCRLKIDQELIQQLKIEGAKTKNDSEKVAADVKVKESEIITNKQRLADLEVRKLLASAGLSEKDTRSLERVMKGVTAYFKMTGVNFSSHGGYVINPTMKKAKIFQVWGVPQVEAVDTIWNAINSCSKK